MNATENTLNTLKKTLAIQPVFCHILTVSDKQKLFIEATTPSGYKILWRQPEAASVNEAFEQALFQLATLSVPHRLELWSKAHAESTKGFAPIALRPENSRQIYIGNTLKMLANL